MHLFLVIILILITTIVPLSPINVVISLILIKKNKNKRIFLVVRIKKKETNRIFSKRLPKQIEHSHQLGNEIPPIEKSRGNCKCGSSTHKRISHKDCTYSKRARAIELGVEFNESPAKRIKQIEHNITSSISITNIFPNYLEYIDNNNSPIVNTIVVQSDYPTTRRIIRLPNLNSPNLNSLNRMNVSNSNYNLPTTIFRSFTLNSPLTTRKIVTPLHPVNNLNSSIRISPELISREVVGTTTLDVPETVSQTNLIGTKLCKCGSTTHQRTNYSSCPLNKKNNNFTINQKQIKYRQKSKEIAIAEFFEIAKLENFTQQDIFGKHVQTDESKPHFGRHLMPPRNINCPECDALMWFEEKTGGTINKPLFSICCSKGKVKLPVDVELPMSIKELLLQPEFMKNIRTYNAAFSFCSFNANTDEKLNQGSIYTMRIMGMIYHRIGPILPQNGMKAKCAQIYIHDGLDDSTTLRRDYSQKLDPITLKKIHGALLYDCTNIFIEQFKIASEMLKCNPVADLQIRIKTNRNIDKRIYNRPTASEIAVLIPAIEDEQRNREAIVFKKNGSLQFINANKASYDPLMYPLMFPYGQIGWEYNFYKLKLPEIKGKNLLNEIIGNGDDDDSHDSELINNQADIDPSENINLLNNKMNYVSCMQYYSYQLCDRSKSYIQKYGRLFMQYIVDAYSKMEDGRIGFIKRNQDKLRCDTYKNIKDADPIKPGEEIGKRTILPSTYKGSPRNLQQLFQDGMAVIREYGKPDLFITVTCNPQWPEIVEELKDIKNHADKLPIIARVFKLKLQAIMDDIINKQILGKHVAMMYVIEFQKRGLPHAHILIILDDSSKPRNTDDFDRIVSAEIPDKSLHPQAYETVTKSMVHGPCGILNPNSPCMVDGKCSKNYPKDFIEQTQANIDGYPEYRRRDNKITIKTKSGIEIGNNWIIPHNLYLCSKYNCHINVEICSSVQAVKYLFKYIYKGPDKAQTTIEHKEEAIDECKQHIDNRYVSTIEACWHFFGYSMNAQDPPVIRLEMHLEDEQNIIFEEKELLGNVQSKFKNTKLTAWFKLNEDDEEARQHLYHNIPKYYIWKSQARIWQKRKFNKVSKMLGRMYFISPRETERFSMRLLLLNTPGATSFINLRTIGGIKFNTYQEAAIEKGLLADDKIWCETLAEACLVETDTSKIRSLFAMILYLGNPSNPGKLWETHKISLARDYILKERIRLNETYIQFNENIQNLTIFSLNEDLESYNKTTKNFYGLPILPVDFNPRSALSDQNFISNQFIRDHLCYDREKLKKFADECLIKFNHGQSQIYKTIMQSSPENNMFFIDGPGGTGKTFLYNTILAKLRSEGKVGIAVATSGIAANLLDGGQTAHSIFKIPLKIHHESTCNINVNSELADLIRLADVIIWDEAVMAHKYIFKAVELLISECMAFKNSNIQNNNRKFGGKIMIFGGDFRQVLPVVKRGNRSQVVNATIKKTDFWHQVTKLKLIENMRIKSAAANQGKETSQLNKFSEYLLAIGEGLITNTLNTKYIDEIIVDGNIAKNMDEMELIKKIYPDIETNAYNSDFMCERAILSGTNADVDNINKLALAYFPGESKTYLSADSIINKEQEKRYPTEFLNKITATGLPEHKLSLKLHQPIILLRNIAQKNGLCNGTRLTIKGFHKNILRVAIATGKLKSKEFLIPKLTMEPSDFDYPFSIQRVQFPIRSAFAMTINKSQGATLKKVGIYLNSPVFSHGQLYVAMSRVSSLEDIVIATDSLVEGTTRNVVFKEVFS